MGGSKRPIKPADIQNCPILHTTSVCLTTTTLGFDSKYPRTDYPTDQRRDCQKRCPNIPIR
eukprot:1959100-Pleurochrysis_carterae.AAC.1